MEWYYTVLLVILGLILLTVTVVYLFREQIFNWFVATILGAYIISPIDLLPDFIPFAGWGDDMGALIFMIGFIINAIRIRSRNKKKKMSGKILNSSKTN